MPMNTELPGAPAGQVPMGGWSRGERAAAKPRERERAGGGEARADEVAAAAAGYRGIEFGHTDPPRFRAGWKIYRDTIISECDITPSRGRRAIRENPCCAEEGGAAPPPETSDYAAPRGFRGALREFLRFSEEAAARVGLTTQHYQAMLILRACPDGAARHINDLARSSSSSTTAPWAWSTAWCARGWSRARPRAEDRRKVELRLSARGRQVLAKLAGLHRRELERIGPVLERVIADVCREDARDPD